MADSASENETAPNQGASGDVDTAEAPAAPSPDPGPAGAGAPINQGAPGAGPAGGAAYEPGAAARGESPLTVDTEHDAFAERPELYVGAAFAGGLAAALILRLLSR